MVVPEKNATVSKKSAPSFPGCGVQLQICEPQTVTWESTGGRRWKEGCMCAKSPQSSLTLCNPMGCSPLGSSVHGILQARILEWVAMPSPAGLLRVKSSLCQLRSVWSRASDLASSSFIICTMVKLRLIVTILTSYSCWKNAYESLIMIPASTQ